MRLGIQPVSSLVKASGPQMEVALPSKRHSGTCEDSACYYNLGMENSVQSLRMLLIPYNAQSIKVPSPK